jgi:BirA family biotin operon repressor/biotin-[acetyl-CoA-carboxylase] ligase
MNFTILRFDTIDSTNTEALKQARQGAPEGLCILARQQTAGRGRHERKWFSPSDAGLYMSVLLRPTLPPRDLPLITMMSAVAVCDTLSEIGLKPDIKWPNDILVAEKKISGILAETTETELGTGVAVGIGINLEPVDLPDIPDRSTSIRFESTREVSIDDLMDRLLTRFGLAYETLSGEAGRERILDDWRERSSYYRGKNVRVDSGNTVIVGVTDGLEPNGALRVIKADGDVAIVQAGDVEQLREEN